jgi:hypothetical protein
MPDDGSLKIAYEEVRAQLDRQFEQIDSLNVRAHQVLGFAAGALALVTGLQPPDGNWRASVLFGIGIVGFALTGRAAMYAWSVVGWRRDPKPSQLWPAYERWPEGWLREQILLNWIASHVANQLAIDKKVHHLRLSQFFLALEVAYLGAMLMVLPYFK